VCVCVCGTVLTDSPGVPPSATAHELFRGFSYVAPSLLDDVDHNTAVVHDTQTLMSASLALHCLHSLSMATASGQDFRNFDIGHEMC